MRMVTRRWSDIERILQVRSMLTDWVRSISLVDMFEGRRNVPLTREGVCIILVRTTRNRVKITRKMFLK